jgi:hypothetical protein
MTEELCIRPELARAAVRQRIGILCTSLQGLLRQSRSWATGIQICTPYRPSWRMLHGSHTRRCESQLGCRPSDCKMHFIKTSVEAAFLYRSIPITT